MPCQWEACESGATCFPFGYTQGIAPTMDPLMPNVSLMELDLFLRVGKPRAKAV